MADFIFNIAKGRIAHYASLPGTNDALIMVPIETSGIETDATLKDYNDLAAILAAANNEQATMGRQTLANVVAVVNDTDDRVDIDCDDVVWAAATGNAVSAVIICYDPDTTAGTDADIIPLSKHDFAVTPNGSDITATIGAAGFQRAS